MQVEFFGKTFEITKDFITIGDFSLYWYAVFITIGASVAFIYAMRRAADFGIDADKLFDCVIVGFITAIIGARLYYVIFNYDEFSGDFWKIFKIREGGIAIYGSIIGALIGGGIMCKIKKVNILAAFDLTSIGFLFGQAIGRWGNFINQEAFGAKIESDSILSVFGMKSDNTMYETKYGYVHPCFFYESIWCLLGFVLIHTLSRRKKYNGQCLYMYMVWYGFGRFFIEGLRTDSLMLGNTNIRVSQALSLLLVIAGASLLLYFNAKHKNNAQVAYEGVFNVDDKDDFDPFVKMTAQDFEDDQTDDNTTTDQTERQNDNG